MALTPVKGRNGACRGRGCVAISGLAVGISERVLEHALLYSVAMGYAVSKRLLEHDDQWAVFHRLLQCLLERL